MHKALLIIIIIMVLFVGLPSLAAAGTADELSVTGTYEIAPHSVPAPLSGIHVFPSGRLLIDEGTVLTLLPGASIVNEGSLEIRGSASAPVEFRAENGAWSGIASSPASRAYLSGATFSDFQGPLSLHSSGGTWEDILLLDGIENRLDILPTQGSKPSFSFARLRFRNLDRGAAMLSSGLQMKGAFEKVIGNQIDLEDWHHEDLVPWKATALSIEGGYGYVEFNRAVFPHQCPGRTVGLPGPTRFRMEADRTSCAESELPVVFVPGFGASINLNRLAQPPDGPIDRQGWQFLRYFTPEYFQFLGMLEANRIPYVAAHYDWRLPAERAARDYLLPAIQEARQRFGVSRVNLVAHSYGGLVARAYLQGSYYANDVAQFIEMGTPNAGVASAYFPYEGGELPDGWQAAAPLLRYYSYRFGGLFPDNRAVIQGMVPSLKDLLPVYPTLLHQGAFCPADTLFYANRFLLNLQAGTADLIKKVKTTSIISKKEKTLLYIQVGEAGSEGKWPDGVPLYSFTEADGDGLVSRQSALMPGADSLEVSGLHAALPAAARESVFRLIRPTGPYAEGGPLPSRETLFAFDCAVDVVIRMPDGRSYDSREGASALAARGAELLKTPDLVWLAVPEVEGQYVSEVVSSQDGEVRQWRDGGPILTRMVAAGETWWHGYSSLTPMVSPAVLPTAPPTDSPATDPPKSSALPTAVAESPQVSRSLSVQLPPPMLPLPLFPRLSLPEFSDAPTLQAFPLACPSVSQAQNGKHAFWVAVGGWMAACAGFFLAWRRRDRAGP